MGSHENKQSAQDAYAAFGKGDAEGAMRNIDDSVEWTVRGDNALTGTYNGKQAVGEPDVTTPKVRLAQPRIEKPRAAARSKLARRSNPLDAQAMDTRGRKSVQTSVQTWPCKSGGICNWKR